MLKTEAESRTIAAIRTGMADLYAIFTELADDCIAASPFFSNQITPPERDQLMADGFKLTLGENIITIQWSDRGIAASTTIDRTIGVV